MRRCNKCGNEVDDESVFCLNCGVKLNNYNYNINNKSNLSKQALEEKRKLLIKKKEKLDEKKINLKMKIDEQKIAIAERQAQIKEGKKRYAEEMARREEQEAIKAGEKQRNDDIVVLIFFSLVVLFISVMCFANQSFSIGVIMALFLALLIVCTVLKYSNNLRIREIRNIISLRYETSFNDIANVQNISVRKTKSIINGIIDRNEIKNIYTDLKKGVVINPKFYKNEDKTMESKPERIIICPFCGGENNMTSGDNKCEYCGNIISEV